METNWEFTELRGRLQNSALGYENLKTSATLAGKNLGCFNIFLVLAVDWLIWRMIFKICLPLWLVTNLSCVSPWSYHITYQVLGENCRLIDLLSIILKSVLDQNKPNQAEYGHFQKFLINQLINRFCPKCD